VGEGVRGLGGPVVGEALVRGAAGQQGPGVTHPRAHGALHGRVLGPGRPSAVGEAVPGVLVGMPWRLHHPVHGQVLDDDDLSHGWSLLLWSLTSCTSGGCPDRHVGFIRERTEPAAVTRAQVSMRTCSGSVVDWPVGSLTLMRTHSPSGTWPQSKGTQAVCIRSGRSSRGSSSSQPTSATTRSITPPDQVMEIVPPDRL